MSRLLALPLVATLIAAGWGPPVVAQQNAAQDNAGKNDAEEAAADIAVSEPDEHGLVTKLRPLLPKTASGDPLRFALHFEKPEGPLDHADEKFGPQILDRAATLQTFDVAVKSPGGQWRVLQPKAVEMPPRKTTFYQNPTFLLEVRPDALVSLSMDGREEMGLPWKWDHDPTVPGEYSFAVRGTLKLSTNRRTVRQRGKPPFPPRKRMCRFAANRSASRSSGRT